MTSSETKIAITAVAALSAVKLGLAAHLGVLPDEALYWVWSQRLDAGYFDQPPLVAWAIAATGASSGLALRWTGVLVGVLAPLVLWRHAGDRLLWLVWWWGLPSLAWLGLFATPDAWLLPLWALSLAGALAGGPGWLLAGGAGGLAFLAKYSALALVPAWMVAGWDERRSPWPWVGAALAVAVVAPNLRWNWTHGWVTFGFQFQEGLDHPHAPGLVGPVLVLAQQLGVVTPIAAGAGLVWLVHRPRDRVDRVAWASAAPMLLFFAIAAVGAPPEAHWPTPAWIGVGLGLSRSRGRRLRAAWLGAATACTVTTLLAVHAVMPLVRVPVDPRDRLAEGPLLANAVAGWVLPEGGALGASLPSLPILTERYQEAALLQWHLGATARPHPGCGRPTQYDLWPEPLPADAWFVRPATSGPLTCVGPDYTPDVPRELRGVDERGRVVGRWQLFRIRR